jgi:SH3-like domain-containing protein
MRLFYLGIFCALAFSALAEKTENPRVPRFESLKSNDIVMRVGPGYNYPIHWEYRRAHLPIEVIAEFEDWRKVRDKSGETGWMHKKMLSQKRYVIILEDNLLLHKKEEPESPTVARFQKNAMAQVVKCNAQNCYLMAKTPASTIKGWCSRRALWGLYSHEIVVK